jgi:hemerythrin
MKEESTGRSVTEQHRRLDSMFEELLATMREGEEADAVEDAFGRLREALEAHVDHEDRLYYPALSALRPKHRAVLDGLIASHKGFRARLDEISGWLVARDLAAAERAIGAFAGTFAVHEAAEERLLQDIDAELFDA